MEREGAAWLRGLLGALGWGAAHAYAAWARSLDAHARALHAALRAVFERPRAVSEWAAAVGLVAETLAALSAHLTEPVPRELDAAHAAHVGAVLALVWGRLVALLDVLHAAPASAVAAVLDGAAACVLGLARRPEARIDASARCNELLRRTVAVIEGFPRTAAVLGVHALSLHWLDECAVLAQSRLAARPPPPPQPHAYSRDGAGDIALPECHFSAEELRTDVHGDEEAGLAWMWLDDDVEAVRLLDAWLVLQHDLALVPRVEHASPSRLCFAVAAVPPAPTGPLFTALRAAYLRALRHCPRLAHSIPLRVCTVTLISFEPRVLSYTLRHVFSRVSAFDWAGVGEGFTLLHTWIRALTTVRRSVDAEFDVPFFQCVCDGLAATEHHQVMARLMQLLHAMLPVVAGECRRRLVGEWLLKRHFFNFFLHWDEVVRNYFHQLLFFGVTRRPWSELISQRVHERGSEHVYWPGCDGEGEAITDRALFDKMRAYVQLVLDEGALPAQLRPYAPRALREWHWLIATLGDKQAELARAASLAACDGEGDGDRPSWQWRPVPLALLDVSSQRLSGGAPW